MTNLESKRNKIECLVNLYRALGRPTLEENDAYLVADVPSVSEKIIALILKVHKIYPDFVEKFLLDGNKQDGSCDSHQSVNSHLELEIRLPPNYFYPDLATFIKSSSKLSMGQFRDDFYLVDGDYLAREDSIPKPLKQLEKICAWIQFLQTILPHTETKPNWLSFILFPESPDGNGRSKRVFHSKIQLSDIKFDLSKTSEFLEIAGKEDLHASERKSVFRQALAELLEHQIDDRKAFSYILENMDKLYQTYHDNYERYINSFSIEKLKAEVISDYNQFSVQINSALNDIIAKAFAIPASLAAAALLIRLDNFASHIVMILVVIVTTIITFLMLSWQVKSIKLIKKHISITFSKFSNSGASGSDFANDKKEELENSVRSVSFRLKILLFLSWLPILVIGGYIWLQYPMIKETTFSLISQFSALFEPAPPS